ncbi:predicted protein [Histoplasma mississippiense (nom. inval.)]|uniref:predicted protein n=1 Tax=Ajellomyces capsulatus (strain NAm1 / WU24) TaxID=2059318 RepID=UPI000157C1F7|nr:predicted protein [Histoplasma mississippiense (nom. inval.)]EDN07184.1 predicted protein [Histoplasma mississippiense (nom. inval.)]
MPKIDTTKCKLQREENTPSEERRKDSKKKETQAAKTAPLNADANDITDHNENNNDNNDDDDS